MLKSTFYCDESGNTGTNWLDFDQTFFVYGGWLVPDSSKNTIITEINHIFGKSQAEELKSKKFFKLGSSNRYFLKMVTFMINFRPVSCFPIFIVVEKAYIVAPKMIETFFDPAYNISLKDEITFDIKLKKKLSEIVVGSNAVKLFSTLIHDGNISLAQMKEIQIELARKFSDMPNVNHNISCLTDAELRKMVEEFQCKNNSRTLTIPVLCSLMNLLQKFSQNNKVETTIIHDNISGFNEWLDIIKSCFLSEGPDQVVRTEYIEFHSKLKNIKDLKLEDSKNSRIIQVADLLCGFIYKCFFKINNDAELDDIESKIMKSMFVSRGTPFIWDSIFSEGLLTKVCNAIGCNANCVNDGEINYRSIDEKFLNYLK